MRIAGIAGVALIAVGILILAHGWKDASERGGLRIGDFKASVAEKRAAPPWIGGVYIVAGVLMVVAERRHRVTRRGDR
jgi:hypothetical protein